MKMKINLNSIEKSSNSGVNTSKGITKLSADDSNYDENIRIPEPITK